MGFIFILLLSTSGSRQVILSYWPGYPHFNPYTHVLHGLNLYHVAYFLFNNTFSKFSLLCLVFSATIGAQFVLSHDVHFRSNNGQIGQAACDTSSGRCAAVCTNRVTNILEKCLLSLLHATWCCREGCIVFYIILEKHEASITIMPHACSAAKRVICWL